MAKESQSSPQVSVIIPSYNCAAYLPDALKSVFAQTLKEIEVVVVDDGSTDNTHEVIAPWRERILFLAQERGGVAAARNAGIAASSAPYIAFLDADDRWLPSKLERQVLALKSKSNAALSCTDFSIAYDDGRTIGSFFCRNPPFVGSDLFVRMVQNCFIFSSTAMIRRNALLQIGVFDTSPDVAEDLHLWLRFAAKYNVAIVSEVLCVKRERAASALLHPQQQAPPSSDIFGATRENSLGRPYELTVKSEIGALEKILSSSPDISAKRRYALLRQSGKLRCDLARHLLIHDRQQDSRSVLKPALRARPLRACALFALSLFPAYTFRRMRGIKKGVRIFL